MQFQGFSLPILIEKAQEVNQIFLIQDTLE